MSLYANATAIAAATAKQSARPGRLIHEAWIDLASRRRASMTHARSANTYVIEPVTTGISDTVFVEEPSLNVIWAVPDGIDGTHTAPAAPVEIVCHVAED